ncbi:MAG: glycosyltransferase family 4 protein [Bacteroidota bacterium]|nr:glycosyltransferase family 4 protein [Bacteroidota bacterium]
MKILHIADRMDWTDGASRHVFLLACTQRTRGHEVRILVSGGNALDLLEKERLPYSVHPCLGHAGRTPGRFLHGIIVLRRLVKGFQPDIIHAHHFYAANQARLAVPSHRRLVLTVHAAIPSVGVLPHTVGSLIIAVSDAVRAHLLRTERWVRRKVVTIRYGVSGMGYADETRSYPRFALLESARERSFTIAYAGRITRVKGWEILLDALTRCHSGKGKQDETGISEGNSDSPHQRYTLVVAGEGPDDILLQDTARERGVPLIHFGRLKDIQPVLAVSHILVVPSLGLEGLPMVILEAGLSGTAVIASATEGVPEIIEDGVTGLLVPPGNAQALHTAIERLRTEPELRTRLAENLSERVAREFTVERMADETDAVYRQVLTAD